MVELYVSGDDVDSAVAIERLRAGAQEVQREGALVRFLERIFVPEDETCLVIYEAESVEAVVEAARRAGLDFERVTEATADPADR